MAAPTSDDVLLVRRLLVAARAKSRAVAEQLHPAWLQMAGQRIGIDGTRALGNADCSAALAAVYRLQWPSLSSLRLRAHRIAVLPRADMMRVLAFIALHAQRERVRRCIGRPLRGALIDRVGEHVGAMGLDGRGHLGRIDEAREVGRADQAVVDAESARSMGEPNSHACSGR